MHKSGDDRVTSVCSFADYNWRVWPQTSQASLERGLSEKTTARRRTSRMQAARSR